MEITIFKLDELSINRSLYREMDFNLFFPIAGHNFNVLNNFVVGLVGGVVSNSLGIGSGIVVTPALLTLIGVPPLWQ